MSFCEIKVGKIYDWKSKTIYWVYFGSKITVAPYQKFRGPPIPLFNGNNFISALIKNNHQIVNILYIWDND